MIINAKNSGILFKSLLSTSKFTFVRNDNVEIQSLLQNLWDNTDEEFKNAQMKIVRTRVIMNLWDIKIENLPVEIDTPYKALLESNLTWARIEKDDELTLDEVLKVTQQSVEEYTQLEELINAEVYYIINNDIAMSGDFDGDVLNTISYDEEHDLTHSVRPGEEPQTRDREGDIVQFTEVTEETAHIAIRRLRLFGIPEEEINKVKDDVDMLSELYTKVNEHYKHTNH